MNITIYFRHTVSKKVFAFTAPQNFGFTAAAYSAALSHYGDGNFMAFASR